MIVNQKALLMAAPIKGMLNAKHRAHGVSHGLAEAGYDIRIAQAVRFIPQGETVVVPELIHDEDGASPLYKAHRDTIFVTGVRQGLSYTTQEHGRFTLASAVEEFQMPADLVGEVKDKSTWARKGLSVFNTVIEPGWKGFLTLELVYHGNVPLTIPAGAGIAQVLFKRLEMPMFYDGKYQNQASGPVEAILEAL